MNPAVVPIPAMKSIDASRTASKTWGIEPSGKALVGISAPDIVAAAITAGAELTCIGAEYQKNPFCVMSLADKPIKTPARKFDVVTARAMAPLAGFVAQLLANLLDADAGRPWHVLDIAAGHGLFGITLAARNPRASVVALDWANVLEVARANAAAAGRSAGF